MIHVHHRKTISSSSAGPARMDLLTVKCITIYLALAHGTLLGELPAFSIWYIVINTLDVEEFAQGVAQNGEAAALPFQYERVGCNSAGIFSVRQVLSVKSFGVRGRERSITTARRSYPERNCFPRHILMNHVLLPGLDKS